MSGPTVGHAHAPRWRGGLLGQSHTRSPRPGASAGAPDARARPVGARGGMETVDYISSVPNVRYRCLYRSNVSQLYRVPFALEHCPAVRLLVLYVSRVCRVDTLLMLFYSILMVLSYTIRYHRHTCLFIIIRE